MSLTRFLCTTASIALLLPMSAMAQSPAPVAAPVASAPAPTGDNAPVTHGELAKLVREAILNDPGVVMEAAQKFQTQQAADAQKKSAEAVKTLHNELFNDTVSPSVGPANADVTIVEFFDYHCGYCKRLLPTITQLLNDDKKVRVIFREFPILSADSATAAKAALAVYHLSKEKYFAFHTDLMKNTGNFDEKSLLAIAKKVGVNTEKLKAEMAKPDLDAQINANRKIAEELGVHGTPALVIGDQLTPGAVDYNELKKMVANVRSGKPADEGLRQPGQ